MDQPAGYPPDVKVIRVKHGEQVAIQWEYSSADGAKVPHIHEARISETDADVLAAMRLLARWAFPE